MTILITGANGVVSRALLDVLPALLPSPKDLRLLVRDPAKAPDVPGAEVAVGDLDEPASLNEAFTGVDTLWLLTAMGPQAPHATTNAVWAARKAGVRHVVRMSAVGAAHDAPTRNGRLHALSEVELKASGLGWTILKPHFFMQNLLGSVSGTTLYGALGEGRLGMVDVRDIADAAARVLAAPAAHDGKVYTLTGPASLSLREAAAELGPVLGEPITYQPVPPADVHETLLAQGLPAWDAAVYVEYFNAYSAGWGDFTTGDHATVTGRQPRSFAEFARDHADRLRGA
ncbi:NAD(P)H-binding protein [Sphaerisporangium aureirubrum]|uniref:NAD(P)H-binding protein n=1 Tax=Sphaerisporangium aureirubrum TaxID=1544736 RepID=A0ABW1NV13_9ACTN